MNELTTNNQQTMTSIEIAELTGKMHKDVMKAIRNMEPAWEKVQGRKFAAKNLRFAQWRNEDGALLRTDQDGVPVHRHEVQ